jgi:hypothetical protein
MTGLLHISEVRVRRSAIEEANSALRYAGHFGNEGFSLWAGRHDESVFTVETNIVPLQQGHDSGGGVWVQVGADELHRINVWLFENRLMLIAQLHSHPQEAFHSKTDDTFPIATTKGCFSIVVPNFARQEFSFENCAVYRLQSDNRWTNLTKLEVLRLFKVI